MMTETQQAQATTSGDATIAALSRDDATVTEAIVGAVADRDGTDPLALPPLYDAVNIDALEALVEHANDSSAVGLTVAFRYAGWDVTVRADGSVTVE